MMTGLTFFDIKRSVWRKYLTWLSAQGAEKGTPYDYFGVFFKDMKNIRYILHSTELHEDDNNDIFILKSLIQNEFVQKRISEIIQMECEVIHFRKDSNLIYNSLLNFAVDHHLKIITLKSAIDRIINNIISRLKPDKETISCDRYNLLRLLVTHYVNQRPSRPAPGFCLNDVICLLYGTLWYKHIKNESFRRRIELLLESLVFTGDLTEKDDKYYVHGKSIATLVECEKEERRVILQQKMQRRIVHFMLAITTAILLIVIVLLAVAGIIDLPEIWHKILQIKPLRFLLKFI